MILALVAAATLVPTPQLGSAPRPQVKPMNVLVFSRTTGFRHESIKAGREAFAKMAVDRKFTVDMTEDPGVFTKDKLKPYDVVVFLNTTGDVLDDAGQAALQGFLRSRKGFVGIHSATDTEYGWEWYGQMIGAYFKSHPQIQPADIKVEDRNHPTTKMLPEIWRRTDEWYCFRANPRPNVHVLASLDTKTYTGHTMGDDHPIMWCQEFEGGRVWYTGGGHTNESFSEPLFLESLHAGLLWAARR